MPRNMAKQNQWMLYHLLHFFRIACGGIVCLLTPLATNGDHYHRCRGFSGNLQIWVVSPGLGYSGNCLPQSIRYVRYQVGGYQVGNQLGATFSTPWPQPDPWGSNSPQFNLSLEPVPLLAANIEPSKVPVATSTPAARLRSLNHQARGDQRLRQQKWSEARAAYRSAVDAAPDRAEAHLRLGICLVTIQRFDSAVHEFKRALFLDPSISKQKSILKPLFGPESQLVRASTLSKLTDWVQEDYRDSDRLFLMGVMLQLEGDSRAVEFFEGAQRMKRSGDASHLALFAHHHNVAPQAPAADPAQAIPAFKNQPEKLPAGKPLPPLLDAPIPGAPVPMPDL